MKTNTFCLILFLLLGLSLSGFTIDDCYLQTKNMIYNGVDIKTSRDYTRIIFNDGSLLKVDNQDVAAYKHHNQLFMRMPVICEKNDTLCFAMMKYITTKSGISIYQYCCPKGDDVFFEYKEGKFYRRLSASEAKTELTKIGIKTRDD